MTPYWMPTSALPPGDIVVWTGRHAGLWVDGLDEWCCGRVELYDRLDVAPELIVLDALSFPWDALRPSDRDIPLVVALPPDLDEAGVEQVLGEAMLQYLTPYDRIIEARPEVREALARDYGLPSRVWIEVDARNLGGVLAAVREHAGRNLVEMRTDIGTYVLPQDDLITSQLREFGAHQRGDLNALMSILWPDDVVLDIGAHVGTFAVPIAKALGTTGRVIAFEAHPDMFRLLCHNVKANSHGGRVEALHLLLGSRASAPRIPVMLTGNSGGTWFQSSSSGSPGSLSPVTLDSWMEMHHDVISPTLIKLDVEGAEFEVLSGAEQTVAKHRPLLMVEVSRALLARNGSTIRALDEWLESHTYDLYLSAGTRNTQGHGYRLEPLTSLLDEDESVFDVIAVPRESDRRPEVVE